MDLKLREKRVLVTGGSKGIGYACALAFAQEGAQPILAARDPEALCAAAKSIQEKTGIVPLTHAVDLATQDGITGLAAAAGEVDILVNNAGAIPGGSLEQVDDARWRAAWELKLFGYINLTRACLPAMRARNGGVIVNIIGLAGVNPRADYISGAAANAGLAAFTRALGGETPRDGVRVFGINPGQTRTDRLFSLLRQRAEARFGNAERWQDMTRDMPFGRLMEPEEVANMVVFASSPRCSYLSGTVIDLDGGQMYAPAPRQKE